MRMWKSLTRKITNEFFSRCSKFINAALGSRSYNIERQIKIQRLVLQIWVLKWRFKALRGHNNGREINLERSDSICVYGTD